MSSGIPAPIGFVGGPFGFHRLEGAMIDVGVA